MVKAEVPGTGSSGEVPGTVNLIISRDKVKAGRESWGILVTVHLIMWPGLIPGCDRNLAEKRWIVRWEFGK